MTTNKPTSPTDRARSRSEWIFVSAKELPLSQLPFFNTNIPEWLIVIVALLVAAACGNVAHIMLTGDSFYWACSRLQSGFVSGHHAFTVGVGFAFITLAAILASFRVVRHWLLGLIMFLGFGGLVTAGAGAVYGACHRSEAVSFYSVHSIWMECLNHPGQAFTVFFLIFCGVLGTFSAIVDVRRAHQSVRWPTTPGKILDSGVKYYVRAGTRNWRWYVFYRYSVGGIAFEKSRVFFGTTIGPSEAVSIVERFPTGNEVPVYYAPGNPGVSVLMSGVNRHTYPMLFVGPLFFWIAAAVLGFFVL